MQESTNIKKGYDLDPEKWKPTHEYKPRQLWFPLSENVSYWGDEFHQLMLHDHLRMQKFKEAIELSVKYFLDNKSSTDTLRVLDIGTGYGILSYWVLKFAEEFKPDSKVRVYAVEGNPITSGEAYRRLENAGFIWKQLGLDNSNKKAMVINTSSYYLNQAIFDNKFLIEQFDAELWEKYKKNKSFNSFDLIISETLGSIGDNEDIVCILDHAIPEFLNQGGMVIPHSIESYLVPIHSERSDKRNSKTVSIHKNIKESKIETIGKHYIANYGSNKFDMLYDAIIPKEDYLSNPQKIAHWIFSLNDSNLNDNTRREYEKNIVFEVNKDGVFSGFKGFFKSNLVDEKKVGKKIILDIEGDCIEENQTSDCWKNLYLPVETQCDVENRHKIQVTFTRKLQTPNNQESFLYKWEGKNLTIRGIIKNVFRHKHPIVSPFVPPRRTFSSQLIENTNYTLEALHYGQSIFPKTDQEFMEIIRDALINSPMYLDVKPNAEIQVDESEKLKIVNYANEQRHKEITNKCIFAYKSIDEPQKIVFVSADPKESQTEMRNKISGCFYINYSVKTETSPEGYIQVKPLFHFQESSLLAENKDSNISMALIVPNSHFHSLSKDDISDLRDVMMFLQTRMFLMILSKKSQAKEIEKKVEAGILKEASLTAHELKYLAAAFSYTWLVTPSPETKRLINTTSEPWKDDNWTVAPFPELLENIASFLKLWTGEKITEILKEDKLTLISDWIEECWDFVKNLIKTIASKSKRFDSYERIQSSKSLFDQIETNLASKLEIIVDSSINNLIRNVNNNTTISRNWSVLTRWIIHMMFNFIRHGDIESKFKTRVKKLKVQDSTYLWIRVENNRKKPNSKKCVWIPTDFEISKSLTVQGKDVQDAIIEELGAKPNKADDDDPLYFYELTIELKKFGLYDLR